MIVFFIKDFQFKFGSNIVVIIECWFYSWSNNL